MYNALNEQYMFQSQQDRTTGMHALRTPQATHHGDRRWWRRSPRRTR
jgi:hypothetical protein